MELKNFLMHMDGPHRRSAITRICDACSVSRPTVARWIKTGTGIRPIYKQAINKEFGQEIFKS